MEHWLDFGGKHSFPLLVCVVFFYIERLFMSPIACNARFWSTSFTDPHFQSRLRLTSLVYGRFIPSGTSFFEFKLRVCIVSAIFHLWWFYVYIILHNILAVVFSFMYKHFHDISRKIFWYICSNKYHLYITNASSINYQEDKTPSKLTRPISSSWNLLHCR